MSEIGFKEFLRTLEGYKSKFRELHWNAKLMSDHKLCDQIMSTIIEHQDEIAEEGFTIFGKFNFSEFQPICNCYANNTKEALEELEVLIIDLKAAINSDLQLCSISAILDVFLHDIRKYIYLNTLK
jgi:hypothetical protein